MMQQLIGGVLKGIGGAGLNGALNGPVRPARRRRSPFKSTFGVLDGDAAYNTTAEVGAIIDAQAAGGIDELIWQHTVPAQQQIRFGFGTPVYQANQGFLWFAAVDSGTGFQEGVLRLVISNARQTESITVLETNTERLHTQTSTTLATATPTDINQMLPLPEKIEYPVVGEDSLMQLWFHTTLVTTTIDNVGFSIPITVYQ